MRIVTAALAAATVFCATATVRSEPLVTKVGIGTFIHPMQLPEVVHYPQCYYDRPSQCCKDRVHIFAVNGLNPLCLGNFNGLCSYCKDQGFENTYFGQLYTSHWFCSKAREIRARDPGAKIVLVGFSLGANYVQLMANSLRRDGVHVDLLVYLVGDTVKNNHRAFPDNVCRVLNVRAKGLVFTGGDLLFNGEDIDGARNVFLNYRHILIPSRRETLEVLMEELLAQACYPLDGVPSLPGAPTLPSVPAVQTVPTQGVPVSRSTPTSPVPAALASGTYSPVPAALAGQPALYTDTPLPAARILPPATAVSLPR